MSSFARLNGEVFFEIKMNTYSYTIPTPFLDMIQLGTTPMPYIDYSDKKVPGKTNMTTKDVMKQKQEGNKPMYINNTTPIDVQQKQYLTTRAMDTFYNLEHKLFEQFFISDDAKPKTKAELVDRITKGLFVIRDTEGDEIAASDWDDDENETWCFGILNSIKWRDPAKKADFAGKIKAQKELADKLTATKDIIMVSDAATGLKAVQDLEAWVPSNLPS